MLLVGLLEFNLNSLVLPDPNELYSTIVVEHLPTAGVQRFCLNAIDFTAVVFCANAEGSD